jgi:hypothetical protein
MSVRRSIILFTLLQNVSGAPFVAADAAGGFAGDAAFQSRMNLSNVRIASPTPRSWSTKRPRRRENRPQGS